MKKFIATFVMIAMVAVLIPLVAETANAQTNRNNQRRYYVPKKKSTYQKHKNLIDIGVGTGAGTILGAIIGGKKGALIGAAAGAGGGALYTYVINPKTKKRERVRVYRPY